MLPIGIYTSLNPSWRILWYFEVQKHHLTQSRREDEVIIKENKQTTKKEKLSVLKENKKKEKYLDLATELRKPCNMNVVIIQSTITALEKEAVLKKC